MYWTPNFTKSPKGALSVEVLPFLHMLLYIFKPCKVVNEILLKMHVMFKLVSFAVSLSKVPLSRMINPSFEQSDRAF